MHFGKRLFQVKAHSSRNDVLLEGNIFCKYLLEPKYLRNAVNYCKHIDGTRILKLGHLVELIEYDLSVCVSSVIYHYAQTVLSGLVAQIGYTLYFLFLDAVCDRFDKHRLVYLIRYFGNNYPVPVLFNLGACLYRDPSASGHI